MSCRTGTVSIFSIVKCFFLSKPYCVRYPRVSSHFHCLVLLYNSHSSWYLVRAPCLMDVFCSIFLLLLSIKIVFIVLTILILFIATFFVTSLNSLFNICHQCYHMHILLDLLINISY